MLQRVRVEAVRGGGISMLNLDAGFFRDHDAARQKLEESRWPNGAVCTHCGASGKARKIVSGLDNRTRAGLYRCRACGRQFTVTLGTVLQSSHIPLHQWLQAIHLLFSGPRPVSVRCIERTLGITYKSAWIMVQRLRAAEREGRAQSDQQEIEALERPATSLNPIGGGH